MICLFKDRVSVEGGSLGKKFNLKILSKQQQRLSFEEDDGGLIGISKIASILIFQNGTEYNSLTSCNSICMISFCLLSHN